MGYGGTAYNIRYTLRRSSGLAYEKTQSAFGLCAFFLRHIFMALETYGFLIRAIKTSYSFHVMRNFA
ncbi:hypothetical protein FACS1894142_5360 [Spirochaetia bacterium]|nr:hypothetical protein FACS1894142_5360 [Spirochaetia bacterium]